MAQGPKFRSAPLVTSNMSRDAPAGVRLEASWPRLLENKVDVFANYFFKEPIANKEMTIEDARKRFGLYKGDLIYEDETGKLNSVEAKAPDLLSSTGWNDLMGRLFSNVKNIPSAAASEGAIHVQGIAGAVGAAVGKKLGAGRKKGALVGAGIVGAGYDALRSLMTKEKVVPFNTIMAAAEEAGAEGIAQLFGMFMERGLVRDFTREAMDNAKAFASEVKERFGITLTPAEATGLRSLVSQQRHLQNIEPSADVIVEWMRDVRNPRVRAAVNNVLGAIAPREGTFEVRQAAKSAAEEAIGVERKEMQKRAQPHYDASKEIDEVDTPAILGELDRLLGNNRLKAPQREALEGIRKHLYRRDKNPDYDPNTPGSEQFIDVPDTSVEGLDRVKKIIDAQVKWGENPQNAVDTDTINHLKAFRKFMVNKANEATKTADVPEGSYARARKTYEEGMPNITALEKGATGRIAGLEGDSVLRAARYAFQSDISDATTVRALREAFKKAGKEQEFYGLLRSWLQEGIDQVPDEANKSVVNVGKSFYNAMFGPAKSKRRELINVALEEKPAVAETMRWLANALEATGRAMNEGSLTAYNSAGLKALERASEKNQLGGAPALIFPLIDSLEVWRTPSRMTGYIRGILQGRYFDQLADLITSETGLERMAELRKLAPSAEAAISGVAHLLLAKDVEKDLSKYMFEPPITDILPRRPAFEKLYRSISPLVRGKVRRRFIGGKKKKQPQRQTQ